MERARAPESVGDASLYQTDGACRKQPGAAMGPSTYGGAYWKPGRVGDRRALATPPPDATIKIFIGDATNNIAQYKGLLEALRRAVRTGDRRIIFEVDSYLVARQMAEMDAWVCKADSLRSLHAECRVLCDELSDKGIGWTVRHIYREYNKVADALANEAFDDVESDRWDDVAPREARAESGFGGIPAHPTEEEVTDILRQWEWEPRVVRQKLIRELYLRTHPDKGGQASAFRRVNERKEAYLA